MSGGLRNVRVLVTRPKERSLELVFLLEDEGAEVIHLPLLEILPPEDARPLHSAAEHVGRYAWIVFASPAAVVAFAEAVREAGTRDALGRAKVAVVGAQTSRAAKDRGMTVFVETNGTGADLGDALAGRVHPGDELLLPCARDARPELAAALDELGGTVTRVVAYRAEKLQPTAEEIQAAVSSAVVLFASPRTAEAYLEALGDRGREALSKAAVVAIGPTTADAARELGLRVDAVAAEPSSEALVQAAVDVIKKRLDTEAAGDSA